MGFKSQVQGKPRKSIILCIYWLLYGWQYKKKVWNAEQISSNAKLPTVLFSFSESKTDQIVLRITNAILRKCIGKSYKKDSYPNVLFTAFDKVQC